MHWKICYLICWIPAIGRKKKGHKSYTMKRNILILAASNIVLFFLLLCTFFVTGYLSGYASSNKYEAAAWRLYALFVIFHIVINWLVLRRFRLANARHFIVTLFELVLLYGTVAWLYR